MKICLVSPLPLPMGGIATWTEAYVTSDIAKKHKVKVIDTSVRGKRQKNVQKINISEEFKRNINIIKKMKKELNNENYNLIHLNTSCSLMGMLRDLYMIYLSKQKKIKIVTHFHCDTKYMINKKIKEVLFSQICKKSNELFCLNNNSLKHIKGICDTNTTLFPNFIQLEKDNNIKIINLNNKIDNIIFAGHVIKTKGILEILEVAKMKPEIIFTIVGAFSDNHMVDEAKKLSNVILVGEKSKNEVLHLMGNSDLFLFPSHNEGFPNVILEAMSKKLPIIATKVGAIPDILDNDKNSLVDVGDIEKILNLIDVLDNCNLREELVRKNYLKLQQKYELNNVIKSIFNKYESIISR